MSEDIEQARWGVFHPKSFDHFDPTYWFVAHIERATLGCFYIGQGGMTRVYRGLCLARLASRGAAEAFIQDARVIWSQNSDAVHAAKTAIDHALIELRAPLNLAVETRANAIDAFINDHALRRMRLGSTHV